MPRQRNPAKAKVHQALLKVAFVIGIGFLGVVTGSENLGTFYERFEQRYLDSLVPQAPVTQHSEIGPSLFPRTAPQSFEAAKDLIYPAFASDPYDFYCNCPYNPRTRQVNVRACGLETDKWVNRARRIEAEHVVPASTFGRQRSCWRNPPEGVSGRSHCRDTDEEFRLMEADPYNLLPVVGALNAARSNYNMGMVTPKYRDFGDCEFYYDSKARVAEPPDSAKGDVARIHFYFEQRYGLKLSGKQRRMMLAWDRMDPVSPEEAQRAAYLASRVGWSNPFAEGKAQP